MSDGLYLVTAVCMHGSTEVFRQLEEDLFVDEEEREVYDFARRYFRRYGSFPSIQVLEEETSANIPEAEDPVAYYLDRVYERRLFNHIREPFNDLRTALSSRDVEEAKSVVGAMSVSIRALAPDHAVLDTSSVMADVLRDYEHHHRHPGISGITTGWGYLDVQTGGWQNGDLIVWVARPSMGKTWLLIHQTHAAWAAQKSALFVSMEMTLPQVGRRFASYHARVDPDFVRKGRLSYWAERRFRNSLRALENTHNLTWYAGGMKKRAEEIDILIQELAPDVVYVDGIYLMEPANSNNRMGRYEKAAYLVDELKTIAYRRNRPIVVTTQFGREAGKGGKKGSMENIGYTDAFSTHASIILGIKGGRKVRTPQITVRPRAGGGEERIVAYRDLFPYRRVEILKGREGESGEFGLNYSFAPLDFSECSLEVVGTETTDNTAQSSGIRPPE